MLSRTKAEKVEAVDASRVAEMGNIYSSVRYLSMRDFFKWCKRTHYFYGLRKSGTFTNPQSTPFDEEIFLEAVDCFCGMLAKSSVRRNVASMIGASWSLSSERVHYYMDFYKPILQVTPTTVTIGRVDLSRFSNKVCWCGCDINACRLECPILLTPLIPFA